MTKKTTPPQEKDLYAILNVPSDANAETIKRSYFRLVREHTPEKDPQGFERIRKAYETLHDPKRRAEYDALQQYGEEIQRLVEEAEEFIEKEQWKQALRCLKQCLALYPGARYPRQLLTLTQLRLEHYALARKTLEPLLLQEADQAEHHDMLGQIALSESLPLEASEKRTKLLNEAIHAFQKAHQLQPKHPAYLLRLAKSYREAQQKDEEIACLKRVLAPADQIHSTDDLDIYLRLITATLLQKRDQDFQDATQQLHAVAQKVDQNNEVPRAHFYLGHQLSQIATEAYKAGLFQQAAKLLHLAEQLDSTEDYGKMAKLSEKHDTIANELAVWSDDTEIPVAMRAFFHASFASHVSFEKDQELEDLQDNALEAIGALSVRDAENALERFQRLYPNTSQHFAPFVENISEITRTIRQNPPQGTFAWQTGFLTLLQAKHHNEQHPTPRPTTNIAPSAPAVSASHPSPQTSKPPTSSLPSTDTSTSSPPATKGHFGCGGAIVGGLIGLLGGPIGLIVGASIGYAIGLLVDED